MKRTKQAVDVSMQRKAIRQEKAIRLATSLKTALACFGVAMILFAGSARARGTELAATPPMGWNTWYAFGCNVTEADVKATVDAMASNGTKVAGYELEQRLGRVQQELHGCGSETRSGAD